jgi:hypothetical protein
MRTCRRLVRKDTAHCSVTLAAARAREWPNRRGAADEGCLVILVGTGCSVIASTFSSLRVLKSTGEWPAGYERYRWVNMPSAANCLFSLMFLRESSE